MVTRGYTLQTNLKFRKSLGNEMDLPLNGFTIKFAPHVVAT